MITHKQFLQLPKFSLAFFAAIAISRGLFDHEMFDNFSDEDFDATEQAVIAGEALPESYREPILARLLPVERKDFLSRWDSWHSA